jgi:hypothetical protein
VATRGLVCLRQLSHLREWTVSMPWQVQYLLGWECAQHENSLYELRPGLAATSKPIYEIAMRESDTELLLLPAVN